MVIVSSDRHCFLSRLFFFSMSRVYRHVLSFAGNVQSAAQAFGAHCNNNDGWKMEMSSSFVIFIHLKFIDERQYRHTYTINKKMHDQNGCEHDRAGECNALIL